MNKVHIYPSLLALIEKKDAWDSHIQAVEALSTGIHYDIGDGDFVPSLMLGPSDISRVHSSLPIDVHLMVQRPSEYFPRILPSTSVNAISFHIECQEDIHAQIQALRNAGKRVGLALLDSTPADHLDPYMLEIDYVIIMTIKGGFAGTPFIPEVL